MANATIIYFDGTWDCGDIIRNFRTVDSEIEALHVRSFEDGVATVLPNLDCDITDFAEIIAGCFAKDSNFGEEVMSAFNCNENAKFSGIKFNFNGVTLVVTKENADADKIFDMWNAIMESRYLKSCGVDQEVIRIIETTKMEFKDEEACKLWKQYAKVNNNIANYACRWAKYMQHLIRTESMSFRAISVVAASKIEPTGTSGFMHGCAVEILRQCWKYGVGIFMT